MKTKKKPMEIHSSDVLNDFFSVKDKKEFEKTQKNMQLAIRIEEAMKGQGFSKIQFAQVMGVQPSVITRWLSGMHNFTIDTLYDIERTLSMCIINTVEPRLIEVIDRIHVTVSTKSPAGNTAGNFFYGLTGLRALGEPNTKVLQN